LLDESSRYISTAIVEKYFCARRYPSHANGADAFMRRAGRRRPFRHRLRGVDSSTHLRRQPSRPDKLHPDRAGSHRRGAGEFVEPAIVSPGWLTKLSSCGVGASRHQGLLAATVITRRKK
jgi:hypothetical protein